MRMKYNFVDVIAHGTIESRLIVGLMEYYYPTKTDKHFAPIPQHNSETEEVIYGGDGNIYVIPKDFTFT